VVEDVHWAEDALHDLLEGLPAAIPDAPILVLCLARPELLEKRPGRRVTSRLEPLGVEDVDQLLRSLLGDVSVEVRERLAMVSGGNPLFAEELVGMLLDQGVLRVDDGVCRVQGDLEGLALPASVNALLGARLDRLDPNARAALERGAVQGEIFYRGAVVELSAPASRTSVATLLDALASTDLVRSTESSFADDAAFRFKHVLLRESAYQATVKKLRAALHEEFAGWLERVVGDRVTEYEALLGHHLEQAYRYRADLGPVTSETRALGERAAQRLAAAGRRASDRGDLGAAANLLARAAALLPLERRERVEVALAAVEPLAVLMRVAEVETLLDQAADAAALLGDERLVARVNVEKAWVVVHATAEDWSEGSVLAQVGDAMTVFERLGDDIALARALEVVTIVHLYYGRLSEVAAASERGYRHAERAHHVKQEGKHRLGREVADQWSATPFDRVEELLEEDLAWARRTRSVGVEAFAMVRLGVVRALRGDRVGGNDLFARGMSACVELGARIWAFQEQACWIWALTDDTKVAESRLRETYDVLAAAGKRGMLSTVATILAECLYRQGRYDEAGDMVAEAAELGAADDVVTQVYVRVGRAKLSARRGQLAEAEAVAREGIALAAAAEFVDLRGDSLLALAEVLRPAGRNGEAAAALGQALELWEAKGNVVHAGRTRELLAELDASVSRLASVDDGRRT
jgi:tetratricopeptide (TPR) repeat protein